MWELGVGILECFVLIIVICVVHMCMFLCNAQYGVEGGDSRGVAGGPLDNPFVRTGCGVLPSVSSVREFMRELWVGELMEEDLRGSCETTALRHWTGSQRRATRTHMLHHRPPKTGTGPIAVLQAHDG